MSSATSPVWTITVCTQKHCSFFHFDGERETRNTPTHLGSGWKRDGSSQQLDEIARLDDNVRIPCLTRCAHLG